MTTSLVLFVGIPWLAQRVTVYALHGLRDRLFAMSARHEWLRESLLFRDADFILAHKIHMARDASFDDFVTCVSKPGQRPSREESAVIRRMYKSDMDTHFHSAERRDVLFEISELLEQSSNWMLVRGVFGHGALLPLASLIISFAVLKGLGKAVFAETPEAAERRLQQWDFTQLSNAH
jgi:hypothetical protein